MDNVVLTLKNEVSINNSTNFNGAWNVYPYFKSGNILISDIEGGLFIVRKSGT